MGKTILKIMGYTCVVLVSIMILFLLVRVFSGMDAYAFIELNVFKDSLSAVDQSYRSTVFYILGSLFAGVAVFFGVITLVFRR